MAEKATAATRSQPMDDCCFDLVTQAEKKADFLYHVADRYVQDAQAANRPELVNLEYNKAG